jgi:hypothetical protein
VKTHQPKTSEAQIHATTTSTAPKLTQPAGCCPFGAPMQQRTAPEISQIAITVAATSQTACVEPISPSTTASTAR